MSSKKLSAVLGLTAATSMLLAACGGSATPVIQTVVVKETSVVVETKEVEKVVEKTVEVTAAAPEPAAEWTTPHPLLGDERVRKAIAQCSNRDELITSVYPFLSEEDRAKLRMDTFIPRDSAWYAKAVDPNAAIIDYTYDITAAGALLDEAGWTQAEPGALRANANGDPLALKFTTTNAQFRQTWGAVFVRQMQDCGIQLLPSYIPGSIWFGSNSGLQRRDFELGAYAWVGEPEPPSITLYACEQIPTPANNWEGQNYMGWCNQRASDSIKQQANTLNKDERKTLYIAVQEEFSKDMISLPLFQRVEANAYNKDLTGLKSDPTDYFSASAPAWDLPGKDTIVIALTQEPASMFSLAESAAVQHVVAQLVWGSGVTQYEYDYQPVVHEGDQFPTVENGGAVINEVEVKEGDRLTNANGDVGVLTEGKLIGDDGSELGLNGKDAAGADVEIAAGIKLPQLVVTAKVKPGLKWSDGQPVVKADWELGYKVECNKESGAVTYYGCDRTAKFEAVDDVTFVTTYVPGYMPPTYYLVAPLAGLSGGVGVYPAHQVVESEGAYKGKTLAEVDPKDFKTLPEIAETPMGTGPYKIVSWEKGQRITLEANPNFWGGEVKVKNVVVQFFADTNGAVTALLAGDVDIIGKETLGAGTELEAVVNASKEGQVIADVSASPTWEHVDMNLFVR